MAVIIQPSLFSWQDVDALSDLGRLKLVLAAIPDEELVTALERRRANGRNTYPVRPTWNALLAGIVFQHPTVESLLRELRRNGELRDACGFDPLLGADAVPSSSAMSHFMANVIEEQVLINTMFSDLVKTVSQLIPGFGKHLAFDGKAIPSYSTGRTSKTTGEASDPDARWGTKTYRGTKSDGSPWEKVQRWFGYQLHLIVDAESELPVAFEVLPANASEAKRFPVLLDQLAKDQPAIIFDVAEFCSADRGLDSAEINRKLLDELSIKPIIDTRRMWSIEKKDGGLKPDQEITRPLDPNHYDNIVYNERGTLFCVCPVSGELRKMCFRGYEADRGAVAWRCPAAAYGLACAGREECEAAALGRLTAYGRIVRVNLDLDRRIFTPVPRDTTSWYRHYAKRTSVERVNSRIDQVLGFERHTIRGLAKMQARLGLALVVMLAMAVGRIRQGAHDKIRSIVAPSLPLSQAA